MKDTYLVVDEKILAERFDRIDSHIRYLSVGQVIIALTVLVAVIAMVFR